jgi:hypothetical protein
LPAFSVQFHFLSAAAMPDPSFLLPLLLQSLLIPAAISAMILLLFSARHRAWPAPLAIAAGLLASYIATFHAQWSFPPHQALDWLPLVLALALGAIAATRSGALGPRLLLALLVATVAAMPALASNGTARTALVIFAVAALITAVWSSLTAVKVHGQAASLILAIVAGGAGLALMIDASQLLGQLCGALGVALFVCALQKRGRLHFGPAGIGLATLMLGALLAYAHIYAGFGLLMVLLLAGALLAASVAMRQASGPRASIAGIAVAALPVIAVIGLAIKAMQDSGGY